MFKVGCALYYFMAGLGLVLFINYYKYALHVLDALCVHHQEHYKL